MPDTIIATRHPIYTQDYTDWCKWRLAYSGGRDFINKYLVKFSSKETDSDFADRKTVAYVPNFAKAAVDDIKNAIFQRTADVSRVGGPSSYRLAIEGSLGGVDLQSSSMGEYIGTQVLPELLIMKRVGVLIDNSTDLGSTLAEKGNKHPYLDVFHAEDILNWAPRKPVDGFTSLLLKERIDTYDEEYNLPNGTEVRYRLYRKVQEGVLVTFFDAEGDERKTVLLSIEKIPFVLFEVNESLLKDVADYQIALLNLESSDLSFARKANFPFFYEFYDPTTEHPYAKGPAIPGDTGTAAGGKAEKDKEVKVGLSQGRRYKEGLNAPGFINPDPGTLKVSMEKGKQLKEDIRNLLNLNLQNMNPRRQGPESKDMDNRSLEASLSFIGLVLQKGEREIGMHWRAFEGEGDEIQISYPKTYSLQTDEDRQEEADRLDKIQTKIPSPTARKEIAKKVARTLIGHQITHDQLEKIYKEIDEAKTLTADPDVILEAHNAGLVQDITASNALGFNGKDEIEQARKDRALRIKLTMEAQGGPENASEARGAPEFGGETSSEEKVGKRKRGEAATVSE